MVGDAAAVFEGGLGGADVHALVDLEGIGGDDLGIDAEAVADGEREGDGEVGLSAGGGAGDDGGACGQRGRGHARVYERGVEVSDARGRARRPVTIGRRGKCGGRWRRSELEVDSLRRRDRGENCGRGGERENISGVKIGVIGVPGRPGTNMLVRERACRWARPLVI